MKRNFQLWFSCRSACLAMLLLPGFSGAAEAQGTWKTTSGQKVAGQPVGVARHHVSGEKLYIFELVSRKTVRIPRTAFSESTAEKIDAAINDYRDRKSAERAEKAEAMSKLMELEEKRAQEDIERAQQQQREKEEEWRSQTFVDSKGRTWTREEITKHNDAIWLDVERATMKYAERDLGSSEPLGDSLQKGNGVLGGLQQFARDGFPCSREGSGFVYQSIDQFMDHVGRANGKNVELLFEYTDAEDYLLIFPDGRLRTTEEMWNEALLGNWPTAR